MTSLRSTVAILIISLWALLMASSAKGGIDFTPAVMEYVALGMKHQQIRFKHDKRIIEFEPPSGWKFDGSPDRIRLAPPQKNFAEAFITATPLSKPQSLDENTLKLLEEPALAGLPVGSQFAKVEEEIPNSVLVGGNGSFEIILSYQSMGEKFWRSVLVVNLPDTQLKFRLTAKKDDFQSLRREFKASILSWHWIDSDSTRDQVDGTATTPETGFAR